MDPKHEKDYDSASIEAPHAPAKYEFYDPSKESIWTRLGVNAESFKRAPGVTAYVPSLLRYNQDSYTMHVAVKSSPARTMCLTWSGSKRMLPCCNRR